MLEEKKLYERKNNGARRERGVRLKTSAAADGRNGQEHSKIWPLTVQSTNESHPIKRNGSRGVHLGQPRIAEIRIGSSTHPTHTKKEEVTAPLRRAPRFSLGRAVKSALWPSPLIRYHGQGPPMSSLVKHLCRSTRACHHRQQ
jgi:hypothetical protein